MDHTAAFHYINLTLSSSSPSINGVASVISAVSEALLLPIHPWLHSTLFSLQTHFPSEHQETGFSPCDKSHEDDARTRGVRNERQDSGGGSDEAGSTPEVQEAREDEEEVSGA